MDLNRAIGVLTARLLLGFIFFMQGFGKVFNMGIDNVYNSFFKETYQDLLPSFLTIATAYYTSFIELIGGMLLIFGFKKNMALYFLASVLVIVTFGHGLATPIWDLSHVMYRAMLLIFLLVIPASWDKYSLDTLLNQKK
ncbi:MAG: DoxX family protein [Saprospiraceae bacterium]|nr:DoxX family protein [Bacteroidia bacterium]NNE14073.1 DoxX family protein [Saprospiraceae bacterium]